MMNNIKQEVEKLKKSNKLISFVVAGTLSFAMFGGTINHAFATPKKPNIPSTETQEDLDPDTKQKADEIINNLKGQLIKLGVTLPVVDEQYELYAGMDEEQKQKAKEILDKVKSGELTTEEANEQLKELGVEVPDEHHEKLEGLDEETKEQAKEILDKMKSGEITKEEARKKLKELGVSVPEQEENNPLSNLDEETREKAESLIEDAKIQLKEIGADEYYEILNLFSN